VAIGVVDSALEEGGSMKLKFKAYSIYRAIFLLERD
jgi:hypothetical protein